MPARRRRASPRPATRSAPTSWSTPRAAARRCPRLLADIGARRAVEELEDSGFVYYGRHFRSADGSVPPTFGPLLHALRLGLDAHAAGRQRHVGRRPHHQRERRRAAGAAGRRRAGRDGRELPARRALARRRAASTTASTIMAKIEDRHRSFVVDGDAGRHRRGRRSPTRGRAPTRRSAADPDRRRCTRSRCAICCATSRPIPLALAVRGMPPRCRR